MLKMGDNCVVFGAGPIGLELQKTKQLGVDYIVERP